MKSKNRAAVALGRRGAKARNAKLTPAERSEIARKAGLTGGRGRSTCQHCDHLWWQHHNLIGDPSCTVSDCGCTKFRSA